MTLLLRTLTTFFICVFQIFFNLKVKLVFIQTKLKHLQTNFRVMIFSKDFRKAKIGHTDNVSKDFRIYKTGHTDYVSTDLRKDKIEHTDIFPKTLGKPRQDTQIIFQRLKESRDRTDRLCFQ